MTEPTQTLIKDVLRKKQVSLRKLSRETGVSVTTLRRILNGNSKWIYISTYIKILNYKNRPEEYTEIIYLAPGFKPLTNIRIWMD